MIKVILIISTSTPLWSFPHITNVTHFSVLPTPAALAHHPSHQCWQASHATLNSTLPMLAHQPCHPR